MPLGTPFLMHHVDESVLCTGPRPGLDAEGEGTDMGPALCSGSLSGHRVLMSTRCDGVDVSSEPSGKTQKKRFVSETFLGRHAGTLTFTIRLGHGDE